MGVHGAPADRRCGAPSEVRALSAGRRALPPPMGPWSQGSFHFIEAQHVLDPEGYSEPQRTCVQVRRVSLHTREHIQTHGILTHKMQEFCFMIFYHPFDLF